jgi:hypothetical protein
MTRPETDLAQWVRVRARVLLIEHDALAGAEKSNEIIGSSDYPPSKSPATRVDKQGRPRPLILPPEHRRLRRLLMGLIVHRPQH